MSYKKSPNFTELEKEVLTDILRTDGRRDIIEDKRNNGKMILIKENAWDEVVRLFNASHGVNLRTKKQLKDAWKNMKSRTKAKFAEMKRNTRATGGGSAQATGFDAISEKVMGMVPEQIHSLRNPFDDDAVYHEEQEETVRPSTSTSAVESDASSPVITSVSATAAAVGPSSSPTECGSSSLKTKFAMFNVAKRNCDNINGVTPGKQETVKGRILQMAEEEHEKKMRILDLKEEVLELKKRKLQQQLKSCCMCKEQKTSTSDSIREKCPADNVVWQPFAL